MPVVQEYNAPGAVSVIHPSETGEQATARAATMGERRAGIVGDMYARSIGGVGRALAQGSEGVGKIVDEHLTQADVSAKGAEGVALLNTQLKQFNDYAKTADPNDPDVFQKFYDEKWTPAVQKWQDGFRTAEGQRWGNEYAQRMSEHMQNTVTSEAGHAAGAAVLQNLQSSVHQAADMVAHDPSALGAAKDMLTSQFGSMLDNKNLTLDATNQLKEALPKLLTQVGESAFYSRLAKNPSGALADIQGHTFDGFNLDVGRLTNDATQRVKQEQEMALSAQIRGMEIQRMQIDRTSQIAVNNVLKSASTIAPDGSIGLDPTKLVQAFNDNANGMKPTDRLELIRASRESVNESVRPFDHPDVVADVKDTVMNGQDPSAAMHKIDLAVAGKQMTAQTGAEWKAVLNSPFADSLKDPIVHGLYEQSMQGVGSAIVGPTWGVLGIVNKAGDKMLVNQAILDITRRLSTMTAPEVMEALNPSPTNAKSLVNPLALARYLQMKPAYERQYGDQDVARPVTGVPGKSAVRPPLVLGKPPGTE